MATLAAVLGFDLSGSGARELETDTGSTFFDDSGGATYPGLKLAILSRAFPLVASALGIENEIGEDLGFDHLGGQGDHFVTESGRNGAVVSFLVAAFFVSIVTC